MHQIKRRYINIKGFSALHSTLVVTFFLEVVNANILLTQRFWPVVEVK